ncbi:unnamed protein product, partial [marine sediment metagenome]
MCQKLNVIFTRYSILDTGYYITIRYTLPAIRYTKYDIRKI